MLMLFFSPWFLQAYYRGEARCDQDIGIQGDYDLTELVCGACSDVSRAQVGGFMTKFYFLFLCIVLNPGRPTLFFLMVPSETMH